jgi:hypothetical protein
MDFWSGALGFVLGLAANKTSERWTIYRAHRAARRLAGEWIAHDYQPGDSRSIDTQPMLGAGLTVISARSWWQANSHVLDVYAQDVDSGKVRNHHGWIAIDPARPQRATRTIFYEDSDEVEEQRIAISDDCNTLHVFDESVDGGYSKKHALRRRHVSFILNSMEPEFVGVSTLPDVKEEVAILYARRGYAFACFVLSCTWLFIVTVLLYLSGFSVVHVSDPVLIAAIAVIPALFLVFRFLFPSAPTGPHFANLERDPKTGKYRMLV